MGFLNPQTVDSVYKMEPMDKDEVLEYIDHHLRLAGAPTKVFSEPALEAIAAHSGGWPRLINNLAKTSRPAKTKPN